jgi:hypothetical protein
MKVNMGGGEVIALKTPDFDPKNINLADYTGDFYSGELSTVYSVILESGQLIARHFRTGDVVLSLTKPDQFSGNKWYFRSAEFKRDPNGKIAGFSVSGGRVRNLKFVRMD